MLKRSIYLIRHGSIVTEQDKERRYIGQLDFPLSETGVRQAKQLGEFFAKNTITAIFCSDLIRSVDTARIIAEKTAAIPICRKDLREINMGEWEGKTFHEIARDYSREYAERGKNMADYHIPGAETFKEGQSRITAAFFDILGAVAGDILIVGHAGINRLLLCHILGMPINNMFQLAQDYGCINILVAGQEHYGVTLVNGHTNETVNN